MGLLYDPADRDKIRELKAELEHVRKYLSVREQTVNSLFETIADLTKQIVVLEQQVDDEKQLHESAREDALDWQEKYESVKPKPDTFKAYVEWVSSDGGSNWTQTSDVVYGQSITEENRKKSDE